MTIAIHQPEYLPWPGFFNKISNCDAFVILDSVEFSRGGFQNRNRIQTSAGVKWLTIPISGHTKVPINEIQIDNTKGWQKNHYEILKQSYGKTPHFSNLLVFLENFYLKSYFEKLVDANVTIIKYFMEYLGIKKDLVFSSSLKPEGQRTDLLIDICKKLGVSSYLSGQGGKNYLDKKKFMQNNIKLEFQDFTVSQSTPLSILDFIFNHGKAETLKLIS